jgi:hypothetical protein
MTATFSGIRRGSSQTARQRPAKRVNAASTHAGAFAQAGWQCDTILVLFYLESGTGAAEMVITLDPELEAALGELAGRQGVAVEVLALNALRERFLAAGSIQPRDEWERGLLATARECGVSLSDAVLSSEGLYD